jgi:hypothetical protein
MKTASLHEIKSELQHRDQSELMALCLRLAKYKKENKELLTYLLFEAHHEQAYVTGVKEDMDELFTTLPAQNVYLIKKVLRKILRFVNRQVKYSGAKSTEAELRIYFCEKINQAKIPLTPSTVLFNLYQQQVAKILSVIESLPEDVQFDYRGDLEKIRKAS